jgi:hypothetical protein
VGEEDGATLGETEGLKVGEDGATLGETEGQKVGEEDGATLGETEGQKVGEEDGATLGETEGQKVGEEDGATGSNRGLECGRGRWFVTHPSRFFSLIFVLHLLFLPSSLFY